MGGGFFDPVGLFCSFLGHFTVILRFFGDVLEVDSKIKQNDALESKNMQISAKIHQKYAKLCKNKPLFGYKPLVLLKNGQNRRPGYGRFR